MAELVFFDVCDTLYIENTTFGFLEYYFPNGIRASFLRIRKTFVVKALDYLSKKLFGYDLVRHIGISMLKNKSSKELASQAEQYVSEILEHKKNTEVHALLRRYKEEKKEIVLLSGSLDFIVEAISRALGISTYYATTLQKKNDKVLGVIDIDLLGNKKYVIDKYFNKIPYILVTDNLSDFEIAKNAEKSYILTKEKHKVLWKKINNIEIVKLLP